MAIQWGPYTNLGGYSVRIGVDFDYSPSTPNSSTTSLNVDARLYAQSSSYANGNDTWSFSGDLGSASGTKSWSSTGNADYIGIVSATRTIYFDSTRKITVTARLNNAAGSTRDLTLTRSITLPKRPVDEPARPSNTRVFFINDGQQNVLFSNNATTQAPYDKITIGRRIMTPDGVWSDWDSVATLNGSAVRWNDRTTVPNRRYDYRSSARNDAGFSGWDDIDDPYRSTTPATPGKPTATKQASGSILVSRGTITAVASAWQVRRYEDGVLAGSVVTRDDSATTWTHNSPDPTVVHTYETQTITENPDLQSGWSVTSKAVQLETNPLAPTKLMPSNAFDATEATAFTWQHNPQDTTAQRFYEIEWRLDNADPWTSTGKTASTTEMHTWAADTWANGEDVQWRTRTWGAFVDPSPWSTVQTVETSTRPVLALSSPDATVNSTSVTIDWSFYDAEGSTQRAWVTELRSQSGDVLETGTGVGPFTTQKKFDYRLDETDYSVWVRASDSAGLWSEWLGQEFTVSYDPPPQATLQAQFDESTGSVSLLVDVPSAGAGEVEAVSVSVYRLQANGRWFVVAEDVEPGSSIVDALPGTSGLSTYRAVAVSALPSTSVSDDVHVDTSSKIVYVNYGPGFGSVVALWADPSVGLSTTRESTLQYFSGRTKPVAYQGVAITRTYSLTARLFAPGQDTGYPWSQSSWEDIDDLAVADAPLCVRDAEGVRMFAALDSSPSTDGRGTQKRSVSMGFTQVDWTEREVESL